MHDLNKDPRTRVAAGFGTSVIQKNQENYMRKAWSQVQKIIEANKRIRTTVFYMKVALRFTQKTFNQVQPNVLLAISRPVLSRIMGSPATVYQQIRESSLPAAVFSGTFRKLVAPGKRFKKLSGGEKKFEYGMLVTRLNEGSLTPAPLKEIPGGVFTVKDITDKLAANNKVAEGLIDPQKQLESIATIPAQPDFTLKLSDEIKTPPPTVTSLTTDSVEAKNFRKALTEMTKILAVKAPEKVIEPLDINKASSKVKESIDPQKTFPFRLSSMIKFPGYIPLNEPEKIFPAMAYPDFEDPMYKKLTEISDELFLPNLKFIPNNTISLLKTNPRFIESYLIGLNHEMGRELLWREYPTDERGSYFRQFWDVSGIIAPSAPGTNISSEDSEKYKDIKIIHTWDTSSLLGEHNNRNTTAKEQLVLVIRGDLLKKYPNTIIFAQKAESNGDNEETKIKLDLSDEEFTKKVKFPLYRAEVLPDIKFFGFDMTIEQARGTEPTGDPADNLGWYFVVMQAPGTPTFGMDINFNPGNDDLSWDDLSWDQFAEEIKFIKVSVPPSLDPPREIIKWGKDSASMAYILLQKPSMVAVHARQMLANLEFNLIN